MNWRALEQELARRRDSGRAADFWWRDDDATAPTSALARLLDLSGKTHVPLALAVVPLTAEAQLFHGHKIAVIMHGTDHVNRAAAGEKKTEFPAAEPDDAAVARLAKARARLEGLAGDSFLPVLAPPWNRLKPSLVPRLASCGLRGLSRYGARKAAQVAAGVREVNTHVDIIDWHGSRGFVGEDAALDAVIRNLRMGDEPVGLLTHHAVHDGASWSFVEQLFDRTRAAGARWADPVALFPSITQ
jgi:hypothetical protein